MTGWPTGWCLFPGDTLLVMSLENISGKTPLAGYIPAMRQFEVTGIFSMGLYDYDIG